MSHILISYETFKQKIILKNTQWVCSRNKADAFLAFYFFIYELSFGRNVLKFLHLFQGSTVFYYIE